MHRTYPPPPYPLLSRIQIDQQERRRHILGSAQSPVNQIRELRRHQMHETMFPKHRASQPSQGNTGTQEIESP